MVQKTCVKITESKDGSKIIYVCLDGIKEISKKILTQREKKFKMIAECIFRNMVTRDIYERYSDYKGTATMKLSKGKENLRIYCKIEDSVDDLNNPIQRITMVELHHKKNQELSNKEKSILKSIQNKSYDYKEWYQPA